MGIPNERDAYAGLTEREAEIWREPARANLAKHPLSIAYNEVADVALDGKTSWTIQDLFDHDKRFILEEDIRQQTADKMGSARDAFGDHESQVAAKRYYHAAEESLNAFLTEFRKFSEENYAPKKRGKFFSDVSHEYHSSTLFQTNKKTNQPKRQKTLAKEIAQVATFIS